MKMSSATDERNVGITIGVAATLGAYLLLKAGGWRVPLGLLSLVGITRLLSETVSRGEGRAPGKRSSQRSAETSAAPMAAVMAPPQD